MSIVAKKIMMGSGAVALPSDDNFNRTSFLSHFEGANNGVNNAFDDGSTSNHTITANGNVTQGSFGPFARPDGEWAVDFDGSDLLRSASSNEIEFGTGDFTIEFFAYHRSTTDYITTCTSRDSVGSVANGDFWTEGGANFNRISFKNDSGTTTQLNDASGPYPVGQWFHVAAVKEGSALTYYRDGTRIATASVSGTFGRNNAQISFGKFPDNAFFFWDGFISNFRILKGTAQYSGATYTVPTAPLTAITNTSLLTCQSNRFVDNSASAHTITPSGNPAVSAFGPFLTSAVYDAAVNGASAYMDGTGDALNTSSMTVNGTGNFTLELWTYMTSTGGNRTFATFNDAGGATNILQFYVRNGEFKLYSNAGGVRTFSGSATSNQWAFIHLSRSGSTATLKVNNVSFGTASSSENINGVLGIGAYVNQSIGDPYKGYMYNYRVSNNIRSSAIPTQPLGTDSNTKLLLNMADGQAIDSAAQNNLTLVGNANTSTDQAKFGDTSLHLDGTGDYAELTDTNVGNFGTGNFTIECWFRSDQFDSLRTLASKYTTVNGFRSWRLVFQSSSKLQLDITANGNGSPIQNLETAATFNANTWYHLAVVRNGATISIYINGTADSNTLNYGTVNVFTSPTSVLIGAQSNSSGTRYYFDGYIDDFRISNFARYTSNFTAPTAAFADKGQ